MAKKPVDSEYLSSVWERINKAIIEQGIYKNVLAKKCGFERKILSMYTNITIINFARLCEELNVSADYFLFGVDKHKEKTNQSAYQPDVCYADMPRQREIIKEANRLMQCKAEDDSVEEKKRKRNDSSLNKKKQENEKNNIMLNNKCDLGVQKELITLADDFCLLEREDVKHIIETCRNYDEGQKAIMEVYNRVYQ